jgi:hypothetical protein
VTNGLCRSLLDLGLHLSGRRRVIDDDAELALVDEEAACRPLSVRVERDRLDGQVTHMTADHHAHETEKTARDGRQLLGAVLHTRERKHGPSSRKGSKSPRKRVHGGDKAHDDARRRRLPRKTLGRRKPDS